MATINNEAIFASISESKKQLSEVLANVTPDEVLISGILNFVRSKFLTLIIKEVNDSIRRFSEDVSSSNLQMAQDEPVPNEETAESLIDRIWREFYHPVFKYYQSQGQDLKNQEIHLNRKRTVEIRKLNDKFRKASKLSGDFFSDLLKHSLTHHKLEFMIPSVFYQFLGFSVDNTAIDIKKDDQKTIVKLLYIVHRSLLFLGSTSRYRSSLSQFLPKSDQENYDRALEYCHYSELLLPALGEARNQIGMIYSAQNDTLQAVYEFSRSALARVPSKLGSANFNVYLNGTSQTVDDLNRLRLDHNITSKNRYKAVSTYFLAVYGYYFSPSRWRRSEGVLKNGTIVKDVKKDLFKLLTDIAAKGEEVYLLQKLLLLLISGISLSGGDKETSLTPELNNSLKFTFEFIELIEKFFIDHWKTDKSKCLKLLPILRLLLTWLRVNKLALQYAHRDIGFLKNTAILLNLLFKLEPEHDFQQRPTRTQYFPEDVGLKEFNPINRLFWDFDDAHIFDGPDSFSKLIGSFANHDEQEETTLRVYAVGFLGRKIINANRVGIKFEADLNQFNVENAKEIKKVQVPGAQFKQEIKPVTQSETPSAKKNRRRRGANKKAKEQATAPAAIAAPDANAILAPTIGHLQDLTTSPSIGTNSDSIMEISKNHFEMQVNNDENRTSGAEIINGIKDISVSNEPTNSHQAALKIEELESKLTNAKKDQNYATMVDSLVDDSFTSKSGSQTPNKDAVSNWEQKQQNTNQQQFGMSQISNAFPKTFNNFNNITNATNNGAFNSTSFPNASPFPSYQNYYPMYQAQQQTPNPNPQTHADLQLDSLYQQYKGLYGQFQQYQQPQQPQQFQQPPAQSQMNMYAHGYPQYLYQSQPQSQGPGTPNNGYSQNN